MDSVTKHGSLPGGVTLSAKLIGARRTHLDVVYLGTWEALVEVGAITSAMVALRAKYRKGDGRVLHDEHGHRFLLHRLPTKAVPARVRLTRWCSTDFAMQLPGVRELFPEGIPEPDDAEEWRRIVLGLDRPSWPFRDIPRENYEALNDQQKAEVEIQVFGLLKRLASGSDATRVAPPRAARPGYLRLVVDNTNGENTHG